MITLKGQNEGFSSVYKILTNQKVYKIYNQLSFASYHRRKLSDFRKIYDQTYKLNLSPRHKVISKNIIEIDELFVILNDYFWYYEIPGHAVEKLDRILDKNETVNDNCH